MGLLIGVTLWWAISEVKDRKNQHSDTFVYSDNSALYWIVLTSQKGKIEGKLHQQKIIQEIGKVPCMEEKEYSLNGETTEKGYRFKVNVNGRIMEYDAWFSGANLYVHNQGEKAIQLFKAIVEEDLHDYVEEKQQELQMVIDQSEQIEQERLHKFFNELNSIYGYLFSTENGSFQLFLKIDEALLEGELTGSLLMMEKTGIENNPYKETRYALNGITDGLMVQFYTTVDGKANKMKGHFHESATSFDLSFWMTNKKLTFHAVTEEEFKQIYDEFRQY